METFAHLIHAFDSTNKTNAKIEAISQFLKTATDSDKIWFLALFSGRRPKRPVTTTQLKQWALEITGLPEWLFQESYAAVGDLGETIALLLPEASTHTDIPLSEWMARITDLGGQSEADKKEFVLNSWATLSATERFIFNKLIGGSFRIGVSTKTLVAAIAKHYQLDPAAVAHSILGNWEPQTTSFDALVQGEYVDTNLSRPYPFCLAYPLDKEPQELGEVSQWQIEFKWDGIRGQFIKRGDEVFIWSRGEELVTDQFPELVEKLQTWKGNFVIDGEILAFRDEQILGFSHLQQRLNRKVLPKKLLKDIPAGVIFYDLLEHEGIDYRQAPLKDRRTLLEALVTPYLEEHLQLSPLQKVNNWSDVADLRLQARDRQAEGLMLKQIDSLYHVGRKRGDWWKWKIEPYTLDAVLIYAQKGSGRRSAHYTDYTFAVRDGDKLVTIAKAYSGLTDKEIQEVTRFINKNATEKFGPVRTVKPELVFEIAFEGINASNRHKSGVALRFPRIARWRRDKKVSEIDTIEEIKKLITD